VVTPIAQRPVVTEYPDPPQGMVWLGRAGAAGQPSVWSLADDPCRNRVGVLQIRNTAA